MSDGIHLEFTDLTIEEAHALLGALALVRGQTAMADAPNARDEDIERTAAELASPPTPQLRPEPAPVAAPAAEPTTSPSPATVPVPVDSRGVPWHPDHHSGAIGAPNKAGDGSWKKRRGHDPEALKAYEAVHLGNDRSPSSQAAAQTYGTAPSTIAGSGGQLPPAGAPGFSDFRALWRKLEAQPPANMNELQEWVESFGSHPDDPEHENVFARDPAARKEVYDCLLEFAA